MSISRKPCGQAFINGDWVDLGAEIDAGEQHFQSINPVTGDTLWSGYIASESHINMAVDAARAAFKAWSRFGVEKRSSYVARFTELLDKRSEQLAKVIHLETGKPLWEAKTEVASMIGKFAISQHAYQERTGTTDGELLSFKTKLAHRPIGVFAVLGPFNFPGHLPNGHIVPAVVAGNCIVFKPSEQTPWVGEFMVRCWQEAGLPAGVINLVQGGRETGELIAAHDGFDGLLFTGSVKAGRAIHVSFAGKPEKMLALELGGNNPLVVEHVADVQAAVYAIIQSAFITAGQRCTCARRLIVVRSEQNTNLIAALVEAIKAISVGNDDDAFMGSVISNQAADVLLAQQADLIEQGASPLAEMRRIEPDKPLLSPGILDVTGIAQLPDEESFGPLLKLEWVDDLDTAIDQANNTEFGLSAGLLSDSDESWQRFYQSSNAGIVNWNRPLTGASGKAPFGGTGASGNYRPSAYYAADYCAYPVASLIQEKLELPSSLAPGIRLG